MGRETEWGSLTKKKAGGGLEGNGQERGNPLEKEDGRGKPWRKKAGGEPGGRRLRGNHWEKKVEGRRQEGNRG